MTFLVSSRNITDWSSRSISWYRELRNSECIEPDDLCGQSLYYRRKLNSPRVYVELDCFRWVLFLRIAEFVPPPSPLQLPFYGHRRVDSWLGVCEDKSKLERTFELALLVQFVGLPRPVTPELARFLGV